MGVIKINWVSGVIMMTHGVNNKSMKYPHSKPADGD